MWSKHVCLKLWALACVVLFFLVCMPTTTQSEERRENRSGVYYDMCMQNCNKALKIGVAACDKVFQGDDDTNAQDAGNTIVHKDCLAEKVEAFEECKSGCTQ